LDGRFWKRKRPRDFLHLLRESVLGAIEIKV